MKDGNNLLKKHKIQDGGTFTWKFKMTAIFAKFYISLPIHECIDISNPLRIDRNAIFNDIFNYRGNTPPPQNPAGGILLPTFQIEVGGTKEPPPPPG